MNYLKIIYLVIIGLSLLLGIFNSTYCAIALHERKKNKAVKVKDRGLKKVKEVITISYRIVFYDENGKVINDLIVKNKHDIKNALKAASDKAAKYKVECIENKCLK